MKYFRMSYEEVVFKRSYLNIMLLNRSIPSSKLKDRDKDDEVEKDNKPKMAPKKPRQKFRHESEFFASLM